MKYLLGLLLLITFKTNIVAQTTEFAETPAWSDEFDYTGNPDSTKWGYDTGGNGWGNNELENYTDRLENARVENGLLIIEARREKLDTSAYTSARLLSKGKGDFTYGKIEVRAKLPSGRGTWPAIWMLASESNYGEDYWPDNGEIDVMEHVGYEQGNVHGNIHTKAFNHVKGTNKGNSVLLKGVSEDFHTYTCKWTANEIIIGADGKDYFTFAKDPKYGWEEWPFDKPFHLLLNIAVGGSWGGTKGVDPGIFPQRMEVDFVRVYSLKE